MKNREKIYSEFYLIWNISEEEYLNTVGENGVISITYSEIYECMIFLGKNGENYEVRVYKNKPEDKYVPHGCDGFISYEETDEYISFIFEKYLEALQFIEWFPHIHPEYRARPMQKINK